MNELKPCPFCGGAADIEKRGEKYVVKCFHKDNCYLVGRALQKYNVKEAVIRKWNRRVANDDSGS